MTRLERWIYRDLIDFYYDKEKPLPLDIDVVCKEIGVRSDEERLIVVEILRFKFVLTDKGFEHERCETVIAEYRVKAETAQQNGKLGGRPKKANRNPEKPSGLIPVSNPNPVETGSEANHKPRTINQEPIEETAVVIPEQLPEEPPAPLSIDQIPISRGAEISLLMRSSGVEGCNASNPIVQDWAADSRVTDDLLLTAAAMAKERNVARPGPNYLKPIIEQLLNPRATSPPSGVNARDASRAAAAASIGLGAPSNDDKLTYIDGHIRQVD